jgi:hypothetical protein
MKYAACSFLLFFLLGAAQLHAQDIRTSRNIERSFDMEPNAQMDIRNKYGNVIFNTWDRPEVKIRIEITAYGKDGATADKTLGRVEFDFHHSPAFLTVETVIDRQSGFFRDLINSIGDYSGTLISKSKIQIHYEITVPANLGSIKVENRFGDVSLMSFAGRADINLAHGNLRAEKLSGYSRLDLSYGRMYLEYFENGTMILRDINGDVRGSNRIDLKSNGSQLRFGEVPELSLASTNDQISIDHAGHLSGHSDFSRLKVERLSGKSSLNTVYGEVEFRSLDPAVENLILNGKSTDFSVYLIGNHPIDAELTAREDQLYLDEPLRSFSSNYLDEKLKIVQIKGMTAGESASKTRLRVDARGGAVRVVVRNSDAERPTP